MNRYQRQIILPNFGESAQQKLAQARILIIGVGGLGCPVLQTLAASGVGHLGLVDGDKVDITNLHRQILFSEKDLGKLKVDAAVERLEQINSSLIYQKFPFQLNSENAFEIISQFDIIIDGTDDIATRYLINDICALLKKPLVYASLYQFEGQLSVFHYGDEPYNLRHVFPEIPNPESVQTCTESGVLGSLTSIMGTMQAQETIKIITGIGSVLSGKLLVYDAKQNDIYSLNIQKNTEIFEAETLKEILNKNYNFTCENDFRFIESIEEFNKIIKQENVVLVDVRNIEELPKFKSLPIVEIPLNTLSESIEELKNSDTIIFFCQSGKRSQQALQIAQPILNDKQLFHLKEGIKILEHGSKE